eukprot:scaffold10911_cov24-Tisochrysis_lutea.AAC.1
MRHRSCESRVCAPLQLNTTSHLPDLVCSHAAHDTVHDLRLPQLHHADDTQAHEVPLPAHMQSVWTCTKHECAHEVPLPHNIGYGQG